ncbi:MAG TPA: hypothetical protein VM870_09830 [Pyrinomonadaceae bacterium]|nr:hypothetical protein [Pyrinomonadaceae bacterium]
MSPIIDSGNFQRILRRAVILPLVVMGTLALLLAWQINRLLTTAQWSTPTG